MNLIVRQPKSANLTSIEAIFDAEWSNTERAIHPPTASFKQGSIGCRPGIWQQPRGQGHRVVVGLGGGAFMMDVRPERGLYTYTSHGCHITTWENTEKYAIYLLNLAGKGFGSNKNFLLDKRRWTVVKSCIPIPAREPPLMLPQATSDAQITAARWYRESMASSTLKQHWYTLTGLREVYITSVLGNNVVKITVWQNNLLNK